MQTAFKIVNVSICQSNMMKMGDDWSLFKISCFGLINSIHFKHKERENILRNISIAFPIHIFKFV